MKYLLFVLLIGCASHQVKVTGEWNAKAIARRVSVPVQKQIDEKKIVGAVVAIYHKGETKFLSFGSQILDKKNPPNEKTLFEIGSITKPMAGQLLSQAVAAGILKENDRVDSILPQLKGQKTGDITLLELATHTSGLPRLPCNLTDEPDSYYAYNEANLLKGLLDNAFTEKCVLKENPDPTGIYSNWGFGLLGYLIALK